MNLRLTLLGLVLLSTTVLRGQPVITSSDMINQVGLYYRVHANDYDPLDSTAATAYVVPSDLIGDAGPDQFWDFSKGPNDRVFRFDYISPQDVSESVDFPDAKVVERKTSESDGKKENLFFSQIPGTGRTVYGFDTGLESYSLLGITFELTPSGIFVPPIVDFPSQISYGMQWTTVTTYERGLALIDSDPEAGGASDYNMIFTSTSRFKVDAYGTILLPDELDTFGEGLRINEEVTIEIAVPDLVDGTLDTESIRNYYWVMPGYGMVAQLNSIQTSGDVPPPEKFTKATAFLRLFETNKKITPDGGCADPAPVTDLKIRVTGGNVLLTWTKVECATQYRVEYTTSQAALGGWTALGAPTTGSFWQGENTRTDTMRFYRVVSLK